MFSQPINPLPRKCAKCGFPDLDHVPQPFFLIKSRTTAPNELALADNGNFLIRQRVRRVLEIVAPGQCTYFPTCYEGTSQETPWLLAVPNHQVATGKVNPSIPRCQACGEPRSAHPGSQWSECWFGPPCGRQSLAAGWSSESHYEVLNSSTWGSSEQGWHQWISRGRFMSVRLLHLLKKIKVRGFYEATCRKPTPANKGETAWINAKLQILEARGVPLHADGTLSDEEATWFHDFVKRHSRKVRSTFDIKHVEKRLRFKLPKSYVEFITRVGPVSFEDVDEEKGLTARVLAPEELDAKTYRSGALDADDEETNAVDGVMFATTVHGDCFCFDVQKGKKSSPFFVSNTSTTASSPMRGISRHASSDSRAEVSTSDSRGRLGLSCHVTIGASVPTGRVQLMANSMIHHG
jgi:hypothetical protein